MEAHPIDRLSSRAFLVVTGKGGVGKSTVSAVLGRRLAEGAGPEGRRVLVIEIDPRENLHHLLGAPPSGGEIVDVGGGLWLQHLKPRTVIDGVIEERVHLGAVARRIQASPVYQHFIDGAPGLKELAVLEHARRLLDARRFDVVLLDAPATGHGVSLLRAPGLVAEVVRGGPFGRIAEEIAALVQDRERSGVVVVTQAEEMPVEEALDLQDLLAEHLDRRADLLVINSLYPPLPARSPGEPARGPGVPDLWRRRRAVNLRELDRLAESWHGERVGLPLLPIARGPDLVAALGRCLAAGGIDLPGATISGEAP